MSLALKTKRVLVQKYGGKLEVGRRTCWSFPEPSRLAEASREGLLESVRNQRRVDCLVEVASAFANVDEKFLRTAEYGEVEGWLRKIKGIGEWGIGDWAYYIRTGSGPEMNS